MHSSGFDDAATESLMIEAPPARAVGPAHPGRRPFRPVRRMDHWQSRKTSLGVFLAMFFLPSRPRKSEDVLQQAELLSVGAVCSDAPVPMDKEISGH